MMLKDKIDYSMQTISKSVSINPVVFFLFFLSSLFCFSALGICIPLYFTLLLSCSERNVCLSLLFNTESNPTSFRFTHENLF